MRVRMQGRDGGMVVTHINPQNFDPERHQLAEESAP